MRILQASLVWSCVTALWVGPVGNSVAIAQPGDGAANFCDPLSTEYNPERCLIMREFIATAVYGLTKQEIEGASVDELERMTLEAKRKLTTKRTIKNCFIGDLFCSLRATNDPESIAASRPAAFTYTINNDGKDSIALSAAVMAKSYVKPGYLTLHGEWQKNSQQKKEQDNLTLGAGFDFEIFQRRLSQKTKNYIAAAGDQPSAAGSEAEARRQLAERRAAEQDFYSAVISSKVSYNRKGLFGDPSSAPCIADPMLKACGDQFLESLRVTSQIAPFTPSFEARNYSGKGDTYWIFSPTATVFYDRALNDNVEMLSGDLINGGVFGVAGKSTLTISPGVLQNRWELAFTGQIIQAVDRDPMRMMDFEKSSRLFSASLNFALSDASYVGQTESAALIPTIGITYTNGSDSLKGRQSQDTIVIGLNLKY